jgi:hypothetical protein
MELFLEHFLKMLWALLFLLGLGAVGLFLFLLAHKTAVNSIGKISPNFKKDYDEYVFGNQKDDKDDDI